MRTRAALLAVPIIALSACGGSDLAPEAETACQALNDEGPTIIEGLTANVPGSDFEDSIQRLSDAVPDDDSNVEPELYQSFLLMNSELLLITSDLLAGTYLGNTSLLPRMFDAETACNDAGVDVDLS